MNLDENLDYLVVDKSRPLLSLGKSGISLGELKILDTYLARINPADPENRTVIFKKAEFEHLLGVKRIKKGELKKRLKDLMQPLEIEDKSAPNGIALLVLFPFADAYADENGIWTVKMICSPEAMKYIFNIEKIGYLRYKLKNIIKLQSRYSYLMYLYIESNRYRGTWQESLEAMRKILKCDNVSTYDQFREFNSYVLKTCLEEINSITDCKYNYTPIREGRKVIAIEFTIEKTGIEYSERKALEEIEYMSDRDDQIIKFYSYAVNNSFSEEEMESIIKKLESIPESELPSSSMDNYPVKLKRYHYLKDKYEEMLKVLDETILENRFEHILSLL